ncbi:hypothetical protein BDR05DRAFT_613661 [Suillus weaverae]|nr:hypothetical protein BDR05DRAFT_613661 [Suillus weaverae]
MALYNVGPSLGPFHSLRLQLISQGPVIGPVMRGFMGESLGVQFDFYVVTAISGVAAMLGIPLVRESYAPVIRLRLAKLSPDFEKAAERHPAFTVDRIITTQRLGDCRETHRGRV